MCKKVFFAILLISLVMLTALPTTAQSGIEANKALIQRFIDEIWTKNNLKAADEIIADNFVAHFTDQPDADWKTYADNTLGWLAGAFTKGKLVPMVMIAEGDWVAFAMLWGGTSSEGKEILVSDIDFFRIENGKIVEFWPASNTLSMNQQFGWMPATGEVTPDKPWDVKLEPNSASPAELKTRLLIDTLATNSHDMEQILNDYTPTAVLHWIPAGVELKGSKALRESWETTPMEHRIAPRIMVVEGNLAATRYTIFPYMESVPGLRAEMTVLDRFEGDKIAEEWAFWDEATLRLQQDAAATEAVSK